MEVFSITDVKVHNMSTLIDVFQSKSPHKNIKKKIHREREREREERERALKITEMKDIACIYFFDFSIDLA